MPDDKLETSTPPCVVLTSAGAFRPSRRTAPLRLATLTDIVRGTRISRCVSTARPSCPRDVCNLASSPDWSSRLTCDRARSAPAAEKL